jgi:hypothetical protein
MFGKSALWNIFKYHFRHFIICVAVHWMHVTTICCMPAPDATRYIRKDTVLQLLKKRHNQVDSYLECK